MKLCELRHNLWNIGFIEEGLEHTLTCKKPKIQWVKKRFNNRWFADPYILDVTNSEVILLAEEFCYDIHRGRLARVVIDRKTYEEKTFDVILDLKTHLSFPFIYRKNDRIFIMPENSASGHSTIYEYDDNTKKLTLLHHTCEKPLTDATIFEFNGKSYLWSTMTPQPNGKTLSIYNFDPQKMQITENEATVNFSINTARNAGEVFTVNGQLYRPAQDCTKCYGHGVVLQKVEKINNNWLFTEVNSFYPNTFKYNQGLHTFNHYKELIVIDARGFRNPVIGRVITFLFNLIGKK